MRICFVTNDFFPDNIGGVGIYSQQLASRLAQAGHELHVILPYSQKRAEMLTSDSFITHFIYTNHQENPLHFSLLAYRYFQTHLSKTCEIVHANELCGFFFGMLPHKYKLVSACHNSYWDRFSTTDNTKKRMTYRVLMPLERLLYHQADALVIGSEIEWETMQRYKVSKEKVTMIYYGVGFEQGAIDPNLVSELRSDLHIPQNAEVVLFVGRMVERKKPHIVAQAAMEMLAQNSNLYFVIVGDGPDLETLKSCYIHPRLIFTGGIDYADLPLYYALGSVFTLPSVGEGSISLVVLEAASLGLPLILTQDSSGGSPVFRDGENGYLVSPDSVSDLKVALDDALHNREQLGTHSKKRVEQYFSWDSHAARVNDLYHSL